MSATQDSHYPIHLAKLVARRLTDGDISCPQEPILLQLFETLYFASLKTDEARPCRCTVNFMGSTSDHEQLFAAEKNGWMVVPFRQPQRFDVRTLLKLADAADPTVSSIMVYCDTDGELYLGGLVDQELRYGEYVALDATNDPKRPGLFQATITGVGGISVYKNFALLGSLEQNSLVSEYHDVLWEGPVHDRLKNNLRATLHENRAYGKERTIRAYVSHVTDELLIRWQNAICRVLFNIQQYGHGGGLLIVPRCPAEKVHVKYEQTYDRMPRALFQLAKHQILKQQAVDAIARQCQSPKDFVSCEIHFDAVRYQRELDRLKSELLGCVRYIASLSRVDGFVLLDKSLVVHGFGVEARANADVHDVYLAGDVSASDGRLREVPLSQFGTRHRAMMRYCSEQAGALGFVISQDGDIRAMMKHQGKLVLWENINAQLAYRAENRGTLISDFCPETMTGLFQDWAHAVEAHPPL